MTDKDIRTRCVGEGLDPLMPVSDIMSSDVLTLDTNDSAYDALIVMTSRNIHHLPVTSNGRLAGMVTVTDLMNHEGNNAVNISSLVAKANKISELTEISKMLPKLQIRMSKLGTTSDHVGKSISAITMAFTVRLITMAENLLGPAPVPYASACCGLSGQT
ncbi:CBS domain-containing protein [Psychrosphaera algicola]|uniref:CBS domain-containing protein n=1 Tax=Psychrosphaera algicola TaxID=3023714 RepID=A0ABT5FF10_9GAMM|nr:CBS domain-containing protein [Psychrosphaera sp. G1-22]MDC2890129.1 CBS domain-containing protein [Psychrosphaera sp. G1-22]